MVVEEELKAFFSGYASACQIFNKLRIVIFDIGQVEMRVTHSQIAFRHRRVFAWAWIPEKALRRPAAPLVLTVALRRRDVSPRWKEIVEPYPGRFTHHLELFTAGDVDEEVTAWLQEAFITAK